MVPGNGRQQRLDSQMGGRKHERHTPAHRDSQVNTEVWRWKHYNNKAPKAVEVETQGLL